MEVTIFFLKQHQLNKKKMKMTWILMVGNSAAVTWSANEAVVSASDGNPKHSLTRNGAKAAARLNAMQKAAEAPRCFREPCRLCHSSFFNYNTIGFLYLSSKYVHSSQIEPHSQDCTLGGSSHYKVVRSTFFSRHKWKWLLSEQATCPSLTWFQSSLIRSVPNSLTLTITLQRI